MKKLIIFFIISSSVFAANIKLIKNAALIYHENGVKKIIILKNIEEMDVLKHKNLIDVKLYMISKRVILIKNLSFNSYNALENTLTNASMKILKELK